MINSNKAVELRVRLYSENRCTICTMKVPCRHFQNPEEVFPMEKPKKPSFMLTDFMKEINPQKLSLSLVSKEPDRLYKVEHKIKPKAYPFGYKKPKVEIRSFSTRAECRDKMKTKKQFILDELRRKQAEEALKNEQNREIHAIKVRKLMDRQRKTIAEKYRFLTLNLKNFENSKGINNSV